MSLGEQCLGDCLLCKELPTPCTCSTILYHVLSCPSIIHSTLVVIGGAAPTSLAMLAQVFKRSLRKAHFVKYCSVSHRGELLNDCTSLDGVRTAQCFVHDLTGVQACAFNRPWSMLPLEQLLTRGQGADGGPGALCTPDGLVNGTLGGSAVQPMSLLCRPGMTCEPLQVGHSD